MAESNATQVILTDDGIKIIKAQNTADNAAGGITNLNDPNLMSVIEKQNSIGQFAGLTSQYNVLVQNAKDDGIDTTDITTAYNDLNKFMADILADPDHASDIDRATYKKYQDAYNEELAKFQNALQDNANSEFASAASASSQAAEASSQAFVQAQSAVDYANTAIANDKVTSQAVTDLKGGSKLTIQQLQDGIANKVESKDFKTYQKQTADTFLSKVSKKDANNVNLIPYSAMPEADNLQWYEEGTGGTLSATTHAFYHNGADPLYELSTASYTEVYAKSPRFKIKANTTYTFQLKGFASSNVSSMDVFVLGRPNGNTSDFTVAQQIIIAAVLSSSALDYRTVTFTTGAIDEAYLRIDNNGSTDGKISILGFTELKLEPGDTATEYIYSGQDSMISQLSDDINLRVKKGDVANQFNLDAGGALLQTVGSNTKIVLSAPNIIFDTDKPVIIPSANIDTLLVKKTLTTANISANKFSTNNETFIVDEDGAITAKNMTLTGGTLTTPTINASTINGSTINGTTFNGGSRINNSNNTAGYYPMTITPDGAYRSSYFDSAVGLQSSVESGAITYKYRSMIGNGAYLYDNVAIDGQGITLDSGTTTTKDTTFSAAETEDAYISLTTEAGLYLHGSNANIDFGGHLSDDSTSVGMYMNPYGNLIAKSASQYWQISVAGSDNTGGGVVARFGIDSASAYNIIFNRELDIGNFQINTGHTFTSADGGDIHFAKGRGGAANIYAGDVHYNSLVKSSLLSVKKDVKRADTAYWAQLVNSIDLATYQYKSDDNTSHLRLSSIVDDVNDTKQWQLPDVFISRDENGKLNGVDDSVLLNAILATVQEQQKEIDQLNGHLLELEAKLNG
ncbi:phage tail protein [Lactiplantibacillus plantarum]|uniref:phage tail protein n=1 Tax=Lactiplantibacillus plantarum TaxID=1590 RepID=UPI00200BFC5B|nr:phage tail protein [Lactiplantibacillus plantarum]UQB60353.1 phage tail protein [Lactiplantibacillus plantarum]